MTNEQPRRAWLRLGVPLTFAALAILPVVRGLLAGTLAEFAAAVGPGSTMPLALAVVSAVLLDKRHGGFMVRRAVTLVAGTAAGSLVVMLAIMLLVRGGIANSGWWDAVTATAGVVCVAALAAWVALAHGDDRRRSAGVSVEPAAAPPRPDAGGRPPGPTGGAVAPRAVSPLPMSAETPPAPGRQPAPTRPSSWHRATTPWPRKDEDDPQGTLIRPPIRS